MAKKKKYFLKINGDTMTSIVVFSLFFCVVVIVWGMLQAKDGIDSSAIVDSALRVFGTELGICGIMTIFKRWTDAQDRWTDAQDRWTEERRMRRERSNQNEIK